MTSPQAAAIFTARRNWTAQFCQCVILTQLMNCVNTAIISSAARNRNIQEGWLSPTERASVSAISLRQNLATSRESRRYLFIYNYIVVASRRFAGGSIWLRQESLRHILAFPGYAPKTIAVNVTRLERGFNACKTPRCISIFNRFWDIASYWSKIATFSYPTSVYRPRRGWPRRNFAKILIYTKLEWMGYRVVKKAWQ